MMFFGSFGLRHLSLALGLFRFVSFSSFCFHSSRGPSFNHSSIFMHLGSHTQLPNNRLLSVCVLFCFVSFYVSLEMSLFTSISVSLHCRFLFVWIIRRTFFPCGWCFLLVTPGWILDISLLFQSINTHIVLCVFFPFILDIKKFVGRTSRGHTAGRSHRTLDIFSFIFFQSF